jgi:hypothetical protein
MNLTINPTTSKLDLVGSGGSGSSSIKELTSDPVSPSFEQAWVLRNGTGGGIPDGTPIGMLLALTYTGNSGSPFTYQFSYYTKEGTTIRVDLN